MDDYNYQSKDGSKKKEIGIENGTQLYLWLSLCQTLVKIYIFYK